MMNPQQSDFSKRAETLLLGLDLGTTTIKGVVVSADGALCTNASVAAPMSHLGNGHVEYDADDYVRCVFELIRSLTERVASQQIAAVAVAAASGNTLMLDDQNRPLTPVISWMDRRHPPSESQTLAALHKLPIHDLTGWPAIPCFPLMHLAWWKEKQPEAYQQARRVAMNNDYLAYRLTGEWFIDVSTATTFYLQHQENREWHDEILEQLELGSQKLSELVPSGTLIGEVTEAAAAACGLATHTRVYAGSFDHPSAARATGTFDEGSAMLSCGTSWVAFLPVADRQRILNAEMLVDPFLQPAGPWGAMNSLSKVGALVDGFLAELLPEDGRLKEFDRQAEGVPAGANDCRLDPMNLPPFADVAGNHSTGDFCRALMEGVAFRLRHRIEQLEAKAFSFERITMVGGPTNSPVWPQILADVLGKSLILINGQDAGAYGAALLAGTSLGLFEDIRDAYQQTSAKREHVLLPSLESVRGYENLYQQIAADFD